MDAIRDWNTMMRAEVLNSKMSGFVRPMPSHRAETAGDFAGHELGDAFSGRELFEELIAAARLAPSPDNNQPWAFRHRDGAVEVYHVRPRAVNSDIRDIFSWLALGAAIENLVLAASARELDVEVTYYDRPFPSDSAGERIATVRLSEGGRADPLHEQIERRVTNRRPYKRQVPPEDSLDRMTRAAGRAVSAVRWLTDRREINRAAKLIAVADRIRFEHKPFHEELHDVLRYGREHAERAADGLEVRSLEIPPGIGAVLKWLRPWPRMKRLNRLGLSRLFAAISAQQVRASGALGLLTTSDRTDRGYLEAARDLQRLWLQAAAEDLALQYLGSLPLFLTKLELEPESYLPHHAERLRGILEPFDELFPGARDHGLVMLVRVGYAKPPTARSYRYPLDRMVVDDAA
mgnify:FL=1